MRDKTNSWLDRPYTRRDCVRYGLMGIAVDVVFFAWLYREPILKGIKAKVGEVKARITRR